MPRIDAAKTGRGRRAPGLVFSFVFGAAGLAGLPLFRATAAAVGPDVMVLSFTDLGNYGVADGFAGYSIGTKACNRGDAPIDWCDTTGCGEGTSNRDHPVIAQNLYRLRGGRFEQIGMSWLKHGHVSTNTTSADCAAAAGGTCVEPPLGADQLGVGCTDSYTSSLNGNRPLGRRSEVNAARGDFPYPYTRLTATGPYEQRIKAAVADVDPAVNPGALYFVEGHYVASDDAAAGNAFNNASHRQVLVGGAPTFALTQTGIVRVEEPAIFAWRHQDPAVELMVVDVPSSSPLERFHVARKVTEVGGGVWHYEYAVHNFNSTRAARSFAVELAPAATVSNAGFHDVEHHSGEVYATTDWVASTATGAVSWTTDNAEVDPTANALRWSSTFSFWFDATVAPASSFVHHLGLFEPGSPEAVTFRFLHPLFEDGFETGDTTSWSASSP